jgi:hypothetical protein
LEKNAQHLHPVILELFKQVEARNSSAVQAYRDLQAKALYTRQAEEVLGYSGTGVNIVLVPTTVTHWKTEELLADPIKKNSDLGVSAESCMFIERPLTYYRSLHIAEMSLTFVLSQFQLASMMWLNYLETRTTQASCLSVSCFWHQVGWTQRLWSSHGDLKQVLQQRKYNLDLRSDCKIGRPLASAGQTSRSLRKHIPAFDHQYNCIESEYAE